MSFGRREIREVRAREVIDCRGLPTVQVDIFLVDGCLGRADVPAGRSTGSHEAREIRDGGARYRGHGVRRAVANVRDVIGPARGERTSKYNRLQQIEEELGTGAAYPGRGFPAAGLSGRRDGR